MSYRQEVLDAIVALTGGGSGQDAFGRLRVADSFTLFDSTMVEGQDNVSWETTLTAGGTFTHDPDRASGFLATVNAADAVVREQHGYNHYIPGKSQVAVLTFVLGAPVADLVRRTGYFNDNDGIYLEQDGTNALNLVIRSSVSGAPVEIKVPQSEWNIDPFENMDLTKTQILLIDLQWLGVGRVRVGFNVDGMARAVHEFDHANILDSVYMATANLPARYELRQGGAAPGNFEQMCTAVQSEGGFDRFGSIQSVDNGTTAKAIGNGIRNSAISIRMADVLDSGEVNRRIVVPLSLSVDIDQDSLVELMLQHIVDGAPVFGGAPVWSSAGALSGIEYTQDITTVTGGHKIVSQYIRSAAQSGLQGLTSDLFTIPFTPIATLLMARNADNSDSDHLHVMVTPIGQAADVKASLQVREIF